MDESLKATYLRVTGATKPVFAEYLDKVEHLYHAVHLAVRGISSLVGHPRLVELLIPQLRMRGETAEAEAEEKRLPIIRRDAELAKKEESAGFPLIYAQAVVTLWSYTDDLVRSVLAVWIQAEPVTGDVPEVRRLRIRLGDFLEMDELQRWRLVVDLLDQDLPGSRLGIERFETLFATLGLKGDVPEEVKKNVLALHQIRNAVVHQGGKADRRLVKTCPWLNLRIGDPVQITDQWFHQFCDAAAAYATTLMYRFAAKYGVDLNNVVLDQKKIG